MLLDRTTDVDSAVDAMGDRIAISSNGTLGWTIPDLHGSMAAVVASNGASLTDAFRYDPYGEMAGSTTSALPTPWRYQGELLLTDPGTTDLYAGGARDYDPALGVFTSQDSVVGDAQNPLSLNRYLYAWGDPTTMTDPSGHMAVEGDDVCASCNPGKAIHTPGAARQRREEARARREDERREVARLRSQHQAQPAAPNPARARLLANEARIAASYDPRSPGYDDEAKMKAVAHAVSQRISSGHATVPAGVRGPINLEAPRQAKSGPPVNCPEACIEGFAEFMSSSLDDAAATMAAAGAARAADIIQSAKLPFKGDDFDSIKAYEFARRGAEQDAGDAADSAAIGSTVLGTAAKALTILALVLTIQGAINEQRTTQSRHDSVSDTYRGVVKGFFTAVGGAFGFAGATAGCIAVVVCEASGVGGIAAGASGAAGGSWLGSTIGDLAIGGTDLLSQGFHFLVDHH